jgi:hypothetical protein
VDSSEILMAEEDLSIDYRAIMRNVSIHGRQMVRPDDYVLLI